LRAKILAATPTKFDVATPIIGCALSRIAMQRRSGIKAATDELASDFEA
jgi:hypothetical protein